MKLFKGSAEARKKLASVGFYWIYVALLALIGGALGGLATRSTKLDAGDLLSFFGSAIGAGITVAGALYVEHWKTRQRKDADSFLLSQTFLEIARSLEGRTVKSDNNYLLLPEDEGINVVLLNFSSTCKRGSELLLEAKSVIALQDFSTIKLLYDVRNTLEAADDGFQSRRLEWPERARFGVSDEDFFKIVDAQVAGLAKELRDYAVKIRKKVKGKEKGLESN